jgi:hypothetical protein
MVFNLSLHKDLFESFEEKEKKLISVYQDLPEGWFLHKDILNLLHKIEQDLYSNLEKIKKSKWGRLERKIDRNFDKIIKQIRKYLKQIDSYLLKLERGKIEKELATNVLNSMNKLVDLLHLLSFQVNLYPVHLIHRKKLFKDLLDGLAEGIYLLSDISQDTAKKLIEKFTGDQLIVVVQYHTNEKPYLLITKNRFGNLEHHIIKKGRVGVELIISKLMRFLSLRHMVINYKRKLIDDKIEHLNKIAFMEGIRILELGKLNSSDEALNFSYLLGAACADAFVLNLSDRPFNIFINIREFKLLAKSNTTHFLGDKNPIFHIDYEFLETMEPHLYLRGQLFGPYGLLVNFLLTGVDFVITKLKKEEVLQSFNDGYFAELLHIQNNYSNNKSQIDYLLDKNNISYLSGRFNLSSYNVLIDLEMKHLGFVFPKFSVPAHIKGEHNIGHVSDYQLGGLDK